jgi:hypothetical protein
LLGASIVAQWGVLQVPLWLIASAYRLRLDYVGVSPVEFRVPKQQFGLRQLMIFTAIVAILLGVGRALVIHIAPKIGFRPYDEVPVFVFLAVASVLLMLPLILAALLPRFALPAVGLCLLLIGVATAFELPLLSNLNMEGPKTLHFVWINAFSAAWVLAITVVMRVGGYGLSSNPKPGPGR